MNTTTFIIFGVIALVFALLSFVQTGLIKSQKEVIIDLKGENTNLKSKVKALQDELKKYDRGIEDIV